MSAMSTALVSHSPQDLSPLNPSRPTQTPQPPTSSPPTPLAKAPAPPPSPGTFRHPRLTEIISRRSKSTLNESGIRAVTVNGVVLVLTFVFSSDLHRSLTTLFSLLNLLNGTTAASIISTTINLLRLLFLTNVILSLRPVLPYISTQDDVSDIPLTPSQRALLDLPSSKSTTPLSTTSSPSFGTSGYITPPRYQRQFSSGNSPASRQDYPSIDRRSISANYSSSPLSTSRFTMGFSPSPSAPQTQPYTRPRTASGSPFNPTASPLFQKAIRHQHSASQDLESSLSARRSLGPQNLRGDSGYAGVLGRSNLGLGRSQSVKERGSLGQDHAAARGSPVAQKGVNYKWLYDKGFSGPGRDGMVKSESMAF